MTLWPSFSKRIIKRSPQDLRILRYSTLSTQVSRVTIPPTHNLLMLITTSQLTDADHHKFDLDWSIFLVSECDNRGIIRCPVYTAPYVNSSASDWSNASTSRFSLAAGSLDNCQTCRIMSSQISNTDISNNYCAGKIIDKQQRKNILGSINVYM